MSDFQQLNIRPIDSAPQPEIEQNIETNLGLIDNWLELSKEPSTKKAVLIGAGPGLESNLKCGYLHKGMFPPEDYLLFTCKHALPLLMEYGFTNLKCIVLDPRPIDGVSTHGVVRETLYDAATPDRAEFLVASMTDPSVTRYLQEKGFTVTGWHATALAIEKFKDRINFHIGGGTASILRGVGIGANCFGIKEFLLIGIDCSIKPPAREDVDNPNSYLYREADPVTGHQRYLKTFFGEGNGYNSNKYLAHWTTGELAAAASDLENFARTLKANGITMKIIGTDKGRSLAGQLQDLYGS